MACHMPLSGWYSQKVNPSGKRSIVFSPRQGFVDMPVELPCGKCAGCRADQALMWSIRAYHESTQHDRNCFITLTYSDDHLPPGSAIDKRDLQLFFKRLRKAVSPAKLRYIACGEYGELTHRPHYHALIFGLDFRDSRRVMTGEQSWSHPVLNSAWSIGISQVDQLSMASICYVCGYVLKKAGDSDTFSLMSRRPGIGRGWLKKYYEELVRTGQVVIEGREYKVPDRYLLWNEAEFAQLKKARKAYALEQAQKHDPVERRKRADARQVNRQARVDQKRESL